MDGQTDDPAAPSGGGGLAFEARAKVNLHLHVLGRREDGLHLLDSLVVFPDIADRVSAAPVPSSDAEPASELSLSVEGPRAEGVPTGPDNLVLRAARALAEATGLPARAALRLEKTLPAAGGIGGGSSDAAAALRALRELWGAEISDPALEALGLSFGADLPVCLRAPAPTLMGGIGERLRPAPGVPALEMVLANPGVPVPTGAVFGALTRRDGQAADWPTRGVGDLRGLLDWLSQTSNMLGPPAEQVAPPISDTLAALRAQPGCALARMSGSGGTCYALFQRAPQAQAAARALTRAGLWAEAGRTQGS